MPRLSTREPDFDASFASLQADHMICEDSAFTTTEILRAYAVLHQEHGLWTSYWNPLRDLLAGENVARSNFVVFTKILPCIIYQNVNEPDYDLD